jgi:hypothetical protein
MQSNSNTTTYHSSYETKCLDITSKSLSGLESLVDQIPSIGDAEGNGPGGSAGAVVSSDPSSVPHSQAMSSLSSGPPSSLGGHYGDSASGFLPYSHHSAPSSYATASHYASSPYYASDLSASFPVNSLSSAYGSATSSSSMMFGYPGYHHSQYPPNSGSASYGSPTGPPLHLPPSAYGNPSAYATAAAYSGPNPYMQGHPMSSSSHGQRYPQRSFHLRQENMDLGPLGFGGF